MTKIAKLKKTATASILSILLIGTIYPLDMQWLPIQSFVAQAKAAKLVGPRKNIPPKSPKTGGFAMFAMPVKKKISRSGQPTINQFRWLKKKGWKSVVNLRVDGELGQVGDDRKIVGFDNLKFNYLWLPINDATPPTDEQAEQFLQFVRQKKNRPLHIHCQAGVGRTGMMVALYRYSVQGWPMERAIQESELFAGGGSETQKTWLRQWAATHAPAGYPPI